MPTDDISNELSPPRVRLKTFETRNAEVAAEHLYSLHGTRVVVDNFGAPADFSTRVQAASFGGLTLSKHEISSWSHTRETRTNVSLTLMLDGALRYFTGSRVHDHESSTSLAVGRPFETTRAEARRCVALNLAMPVQGIVQRAERLTGETFGDSLISSMVDRIDAASPRARAMARSLKAAFAEISGLESLGVGALAASGYEEVLLNFAVVCLFPSVADKMDVAPPESGTAVIRRARDFIRAHAAEPIDFSHLADGLGISMRALQENFRRYYSSSPRAYLLQCRLDTARQMLLMPGRDNSVTNIGFDCGFGDLSHFSATYREKFGESPSETLKASRRSF